MIITCTGYGSTGSSAISDLFKEFDTVSSYGDFEFRFLQDPYGLFDLEHALLHKNNRLNVDYYIKRFIAYSQNLSASYVYNYEKKFNGKFLVHTENFVDKLLDVQWKGFWHQDVLNSSAPKKMVYYAERIFQKYIMRYEYSSSKLFKNTMYYSNPDSEFFYSCCREYTESLFNDFCESNTGTILVDQLVPPDHISNYSKYFNDLKVIVVDRDPRDLFYLEKYKYKHSWVPYENVEEFVLWYKLIRKDQHKEVSQDNAFLINFEDLIFNYEATVLKLVNFLNLDLRSWKFKKKYFNPDLSKKNTRAWLNDANCKDEISYIEAELQEFLYFK